VSTVCVNNNRVTEHINIVANNVAKDLFPNITGSGNQHKDPVANIGSGSDQKVPNQPEPAL
jgi:hypothetical protein